MKYIIMAGGNYKIWETPRHLTKIYGETLIERTIRLLRENGVTDIAISSNNPVFEQFGVPVLKHKNSYDTDIGSDNGKWYDAFYLTNEPTCYIFGDVVFSPEAIKTIVNKKTTDIDFFGSMKPFASNYIKEHEEPFALKVVNTEHLKDALIKTRELDAEHKFWRRPIMWEVWTVIKNAPLQTKRNQYTTDYSVINDYTCDIDKKEDILKIQKAIGGIDMVKLEVVEGFTLGRFEELIDIERAGTDTYGQLFVGDKFTCTEDLADYLLGANRLQKPFVKVIEIIPAKEPEPNHAIKVEIPKRTIKKPTTKKKSTK